MVFPAPRAQCHAQNAFKSALGIDFKDLTEEWQRQMKREYWPELAGRKEYADADLGPQLLAVKSAARGSLDGHLLALAAARGVLLDLNGAPLRIRHGFRHGLSPNELFAWAGNGRSSMGEVALETVKTILSGNKVNGVKVIPAISIRPVLEPVDTPRPHFRSFSISRTGKNSHCSIMFTFCKNIISIII